MMYLSSLLTAMLMVMMEGGDELEGDSSIPIYMSTGERKRPEYLVESVCMASEEPSTHQEAVCGQRSGRWKQAMEEEMKSLQSNGVWELVEPP